MKLTLLAIGAFMLGWMIPEFLGAIVRKEQPILLNIWTGVASAIFVIGASL